MLKKPKIMIAIASAAGVLVLVGFTRWLGGRTCCLCELEQINGAKDAWSIQYHKTTNDTPTWADLQPIVFPGRTNRPLDFRCPKGGTYKIGRVGEPPTCSIGGFGHSLPGHLTTI
jgi:hypothetical protein